MDSVSGKWCSLLGLRKTRRANLSLYLAAVLSFSIVHKDIEYGCI